MKYSQILATQRHTYFLDEIVLSSSLSRAEAKRLERLTKAGEMKRLRPGIYANGALTEKEVELVVRRNWQRIAGAVAPGGVVSHISAITKGLQDGNFVTISHPSSYRKTISFPGLDIILLAGPGPLPFDNPLGNTGLYWAGRTRAIIENLGKRTPSRAGRNEVEKLLVTILNINGEKALNELRDQAISIGLLLDKEKEVEILRTIIGALLGSHARSGLRTREGRLVAQGTPVDSKRMARFEVLAAYLRNAVLPCIPNHVAAGAPRHYFAFVESYFSNYVEGTKFEITEARDIVLNNQPSETRPTDSHDILGVFRLAISSPYRDSPPVAGTDFLPGLETWHAEMLRMRPEASPGKTKLGPNYAGNTKFVEPGLVRGTAEEGSRLALSVPEGLARAIYYAFIISEIHPFIDGNGRLSRLVLNAELTRMGLNRIIIPTLYYPQYADGARELTRGNDPDGFVRAITKMARWCIQFNFTDVEALTQELRQTNAFEESPVQFKLLNLDGTTVLPV